MNSAQLHWSEFLRFSLEAGVELREAGAVSPETLPPVAPHDLQSLIDRANSVLLQNLARSLPGPAFLLGFVRGSMVKNRLEVAQTWWPRVQHCFGLESIIAELAQQYGRTAVDTALEKIRTKVNLKLLRDRDKMGPAKLVVRLKRPTNEFLCAENYPALADFISRVSVLANSCDALTREILMESEVGEALPQTVRQYRQLLERFGLNGAGETILRNLDAFLQIQKDAGCLHPALPLQKEAIRGVAQVLDTEEEPARRLIELFRFAWICRLDTEKNFSDFTLKSVVVVPMPEGKPGQGEEHAAELLSTVFKALERTTETQPDLQRFSATYPEVRVRISAFVMALPQPLFATFRALAPLERQLNFFSKYQIGLDYLKAYLCETVRPGSHAAELLTPELFGQIVYLKTKIDKAGGFKHETIASHGLTPAGVKALLAAAIEPRGEDKTDYCAWLFNDVAKDDLVGTIRGMWVWK